jgi:hypothetical protein
LSETYSAHAVEAIKGDPGFFIVIRPDRSAYPTLRRVAMTSARERTAKDFVDFLGNLGVMVHFGPLTGELIAGEERCNELIPQCRRNMDSEREVYIGGRGGQKFMVIYLTDSTTRNELTQWKELLSWIVERFY